MSGAAQRVSIYRIQDREGRGPWKPGFSSSWRSTAGRQPEPPLLGVLRTKRRRGFVRAHGCLTLTELRRWFKRGEYFRLKGAGYEAVRLEVDRIVASTANQVIFDRERPLHEAAEVVELYPWRTSK